MASGPKMDHQGRVDMLGGDKVYAAARQCKLVDVKMPVRREGGVCQDKNFSIAPVLQIGLDYRGVCQEVVGKLQCNLQIMKWSRSCVAYSLVAALGDG